MEHTKVSFLKDHADTVTIIGVNIAIAAILVTMWLSNTNRVDAANTRSDQLYSLIVQQQKDFNDKFYDLLKEVKK